MPRIIHRVFVSSTFEDLREERAEVQKALLMLDCYPVGMELFTADDDETWEFIKRQIAESDYYVVIVAGRYGSMAQDGISFTEKEYDYAREIGKPSIAFLHGDIENLPARFVESDPSIREKLEAFKRKIKPHPVRFFTTPHQLATEVLASLVKLRDSHPAPGFVRADEAADLRKYAALLEENTLLKARIATSETLVAFNGASDELSLTFFTSQLIKETDSDGHSTTRNANIQIDRTFRLSEIFVAFADALLSSNALQHQLERAVGKNLFEKEGRLGNLQGLTERLFGLGLITYDQESYPQMVGPHRAGSGIRTLWRLTELGQKQYGLLRANPQIVTS